MPVTLQSYAVLLSRSGDADKAAKIAELAVEAVNRQHSRRCGIHFQFLDWSKDSYADSGAEPQKLLNKQIVDDADIVLAIFRERMGTPTQDYDSGTEEEIMLALEAGKPVHAYFWQPPSNFEPSDPSQYERLKAFQSRIAGSVIYVTYSSEEDLRERIVHDFTKRMFELEDSKPVRKPTLALSVIGADGMPAPMPAPQPSSFGSTYNTGGFDKLVRQAFEKAASIKLPKPVRAASHPQPFSPATSSMLMSTQLQETSSRFMDVFSGCIQKVEVEDDNRAIVATVLDELGIEVPNDLYFVGELQRNAMLASATLYGGDGIEGTSEEKEKHRALQALVDACKSQQEYKRFLDDMDKLAGLTITVENNGSAPATHVVVELLIPRSLHVPSESIPMPSNNFIKRELDDADLIGRFAGHPFQIPASSIYRDFEDSRVRPESGGSIAPIHIRPSATYPYTPAPLNREDYREEVEYCLEDFNFRPAAEGDVVAVSITFDRVQQNAAYAFPAILPLRNAPLSSLRYRINADELDEPIEGDITFEVGE